MIGKKLASTITLAIIVFLLTGNKIFACPENSTVAKFISEGKVDELKKAIACGFDPHKDSDKALNIAVMRKQPAMEKYLRSIGLKDNGYFIKTVWLRDYYQIQGLAGALNMYKLEKYKYPNEKSWQKDIKKYAGNSKFLDVWNRHLIYKKSQDDKNIILCTLGRDGKKGGKNYDRDICLSDDRDDLMKEWLDIGYSDPSLLF